MTNLEKIITGSKEQVDIYLGEVSAEDFVKDILELKKQYSDKGIVKSMIQELQTTIKDLEQLL